MSYWATAWLTIGGLAVALVVFGFGLLWLGERYNWIAPCDGGATGERVYDGHRIECWHGDVIRVIGPA